MLLRSKILERNKQILDPAQFIAVAMDNFTEKRIRNVPLTSLIENPHRYQWKNHNRKFFITKGFVMKSFGSLFLFFGIGSSVLNLIDYNLSLLMWIDNWGDTVGWAIRGGMIVVGAGLYFLAPGEQQDEETAKAE